MNDQSTPKPKKLLDQIRDAIRLKHYSYSTDKTFVHWAKRYFLFHNKRHPAEMGAAEVEAFLTHLAKDENVSASIQNQALNALLFLYRNVLQKDLAIPIHALRAKTSEHLPTVLSKEETARILSGMQGLHQLMVKLLYGSGLRLMESMRLRVKDIDFEQSQIFSIGSIFNRSAQRDHSPSSSGSQRASTGGQFSCKAGECRQTCQPAYLSTLLCHSSS